MVITNEVLGYKPRTIKGFLPDRSVEPTDIEEE